MSKQTFRKENSMYAVCENKKGDWILVADINTRRFFIYTNKELAEKKKSELLKKWDKKREFAVLYVDINIWEGNFKLYPYGS